MDHIKKSDIAQEGYAQKVFGPDGYIRSEEAEMAYCRFRHGDGVLAHVCKGWEMLYIDNVQGARLLANAKKVGPLKAGDVFIFSADETYHFLFDAEDGYAETILFSPLK